MTVRWDGLLQLRRKLKSIENKLDTRVLRDGLRQAGNLLAKEARAQAPQGEKKKLRKSIRVRLFKEGGRAAGVSIRPKSGISHLVILGTKPHNILSKKGRGLGPGGRFGRRIRHPGARANPFMTRAFDNKRDEALRAVSDALADHVRAEMR